MLKTTQWIPVLVPKDFAEKLLKRAISRGKAKINLNQVMTKLHQTRKKLLKKNPHAYIDYTT